MILNKMPRIIKNIRGKKGVAGTWLVLSEDHFLLLPHFLGNLEK